METGHVSLVPDAIVSALEAFLGMPPGQFPCPVYVIDPNGRVLYCNPSMAAATGYPVEAIVGRLSLTFFTPEAAPEFLGRRVRALLGEHVEPVLRTTMRCSGGERKAVEVAVVNLLAGDRIAGRVAIVYDQSASVALHPERDASHVRIG